MIFLVPIRVIQLLSPTRFSTDLEGGVGNIFMVSFTILEEVASYYVKVFCRIKRVVSCLDVSFRSLSSN